MITIFDLAFLYVYLKNELSWKRILCVSVVANALSVFVIFCSFTSTCSATCSISANYPKSMRISYAQKIAAIIGICSLLLGFTLLRLYPERASEDAVAHSISNGCNDSTQRTHCLDTALLQHISKISEMTGDIFDSVWGLEKEGALHDDPRIFSDMVHDAGMLLIDREFRSMLRSGFAAPLSCKAASTAR